MIEYLYITVIVLFAIGSLLIFVSNKKKEKGERKKAWIKYFGYLAIVNIVLLSIIFDSKYFYYLAIIISVAGFVEICVATVRSRNFIPGSISVFVFIILALIFIWFGKSNQNILLFTYIIVSSFDAFSQLFGQIFGKVKLFPKISPGKTLEGLLGGLFSAIIISSLLYTYIQSPIYKTIIFSILIAAFGFVGDFLASFCKRKFNIKDFSKILPGQGGVLDRFDSLIFSSLIVVLLQYFSII